MSNKKHLPLENEVRREAYNEAQRKDVEKQLSCMGYFDSMMPGSVEEQFHNSCTNGSTSQSTDQVMKRNSQANKVYRFRTFKTVGAYQR